MLRCQSVNIGVIDHKITEVEVSMSFDKNHGSSKADVDESSYNSEIERKCRTASYFNMFAICLIEDLTCKYLLSFGTKFICAHPNNKEFIDKSLQDVSSAAMK